MHLSQKVNIQLVEVLDNARPNEKEVSHQKLRGYS